MNAGFEIPSALEFGVREDLVAFIGPSGCPLEGVAVALLEHFEFSGSLKPTIDVERPEVAGGIA